MLALGYLVSTYDIQLPLEYLGELNIWSLVCYSMAWSMWRYGKSVYTLKANKASLFDNAIIKNLTHAVLLLYKP